MHYDGHDDWLYSKTWAGKEESAELEEKLEREREEEEERQLQNLDDL